MWLSFRSFPANMPIFSQIGDGPVTKGLHFGDSLVHPLLNISLFTETCQRATTKEECEALASQLGLPDTIADTVDGMEWVPYCYYKPDNDENRRLKFNSAVTDNTTPCKDTRKCVCKNGILPTGKINHE